MIPQRDSLGLLKGIDYKYLENGKVDWRAMVEPQFIVPNKQNFEKRNKPVPTSIEGLEDKDLLILLAGFKALADLRGYEDVNFECIAGSDGEVITICRITFLPNFETENRRISFASTANANRENTNGFGRLFCAPIAENRAFVRCLRNFLRIQIIGQDEIAPELPDQPSINQTITPKDRLKDSLKSVNFASFKKLCVSKGIEGADVWNTPDDIPNSSVYDCIGLLKVALANKTNQQSQQKGS